MPGRLKQLTIENFKSYAGKHIIGPFKPFTSIIGPNGSGKSNLMDAICFVVGERTSQLRVKKLSDLIYGAPQGRPQSTHAFVSADFIESDENGAEIRAIRFTRAINGNQSEYRLNEKIVRAEEYTTELERVGIRVRSKNFLVMQGQVEGIALKSARERTQLFEEISGSGELREEYERSRAAMRGNEEEVQQLNAKRRDVLQERREARLEQAEAEKYERQKTELEEAQVTHVLLRLALIEREISDARSDREKASRAAEQQRAAAATSHEELKARRKEQIARCKDLARAEESIKKAETEILHERPNYIKAKEKRIHLETKIKEAQAKLEEKRSIHKRREKEFDTLNKQIDDIEGEMNEWKRSLEAESASQGSRPDLDKKHAEEYRRLRLEADRRTARVDLERQEADRALLDTQHELDKLRTDLAAADEHRRRIASQVDDDKRRAQHLEEAIARLRDEFEKKKGELEEQRRKFDEDTEKARQLEKEVMEMGTRVGDETARKHEDERGAARTELVNRLKSLFPGVIGTLQEICEIPNKRFTLAVTKVFGKAVDAVVVTTARVGRDCIQFLKEQHKEPILFMPLDKLKVKPLEESLRTLSHGNTGRQIPQNSVRMLIDVVELRSGVPPNAKRALQHVCENVLVCDTPDIASYVAYRYDPQHQYKAVALNGVLFQKNGQISGGGEELSRKAARWKERELESFRRAYEEKMREHRETCTRKRDTNEKWLELGKQCASLETQLRHSENSLRQLQSKIQDQGESKKYERQANQLRNTIPELERRLETQQRRVRELNDQRNTVEDEVFGDLCEQLGVPNIRKYAEKEFVLQQERERRNKEYEQQIMTLKQTREYEATRDTLRPIEELEKALKDLKKQHSAGESEERQFSEHMEELEGIKRREEEKRADARSTVESGESDLQSTKKRAGELERALQALVRQQHSAEQRLDGKLAERHNILQTSRIESVSVPLKNGVLEDHAHLFASQAGPTEAPSSQETMDLDVARTETVESTSLSGPNMSQIYEQESHLQFDFSQLREDRLRAFAEGGGGTTCEEVNQRIERLGRDVQEKRNTLARLAAPLEQARQRIEEVREKVAQSGREFEDAKRRALDSKKHFERVKSERLRLFTTAFEQIVTNIDTIYKRLCRQPSAQAFLTAEDSDEPYLSGIQLNCVVPGKRFRPMDSLSGGEKTVAALALLFAIHSVQPAPFYVLDEVDAALDNQNIGRVADYMSEEAHSTRGMQFLVISLKEEFFSRADALVGVYPLESQILSSATLSLDLTVYAEAPTDRNTTVSTTYRTSSDEDSRSNSAASASAAAVNPTASP